MNQKNSFSRRTALKAGLTILTGSALADNALAAPKKPGEVRVIVLAGDYWHNDMMYESHWRRVLGVTGWNLLFAQAGNFITPEVIKETDLLIFSRYGGGNQGFSTDGLVEERPEGDTWMSTEQEDAIIENVTERGMGVLPFHCSIANAGNKKFLAMMGVKEMIMHGPCVNTAFYEMNPYHPITKGVEDFEEVDEIFDAVMLDVPYTPLFRARQDYDLIKKDNGDPYNGGFYAERENFPSKRLAGWTREIGNGRMVFLNCMSYQQVFWKKSMKEIMWRSAHWAMKKDIPESGLIEGRGVDRA